MEAGSVDFFNRHPGLRRAIAVLLAAVLTVACVRWQPLASAANLVTASGPQRLRVTLASGRQLALWSATVTADTLTGLLRVDDSSRVAIPTSQVRSVMVAHTQVGRSILLGVALGLVFFIAVGLATFQGLRGGNWLQLPG